ncbi:SGNH/GDSL hydrolase family protein [Aliiroseovarius crassostreae]|nr:SGNH/GDSL hydrolase family protein [Aliiroseovarius crassostreae]
MLRPLLSVFLLSLALSAVLSAPITAEPAARILAIGDSLIAWNGPGQKSVADVMAQELGEPVKSRAVSGARIIYGLPISGALGMRISRQFNPKQPRDWVVLSGGGNDLWFGCGCNKCDRRMGRMISEDGRSGAVVDLVTKIRKSGARVVMLGYLRSPGVNSPIESCRDEGDAYEARLAMMAKRLKGVHFLSNADLVPHGDKSFHAFDMIHPSIKGSKAIGKRVVELIRREDKGR